MNTDIHARLQLCYPGHATPALDVDIRLPGRGVSAVFGPSGAGKTSLLRCIAGLERASGELRIGQQSWQDDRHFLPTHRRPLGYVFQEASLFPHLSVRGNLAYACRRASTTAASWDHVIALMHLEPLLERHSGQISGGERQRVAIARALLSGPELLLMDEPLAAMDADRKREILPYLEQLHRQLDIPVLYVTHSLDEVARLADHIVVLDGGRVSDAGAAASLLPRIEGPDREDTGVVIEAVVAERDTRWQLMRLDFQGGQLWAGDDGTTNEGRQRLRIRARDVSISRDTTSHSSILNRLPARVEAIESDADGPQALVRLRLGDWLLLARTTRRSVAELDLKPGETVFAQIKAVAIIR